ncbi:MAG: glycosyltransferase [Bacteroidetes bacterium]|nr:glycosyltransferase [Bacteroidota bacterium]
MFYKLKALHKEGVKITLHCFEYGRGEKKELNNYCEKVFYYKRKANKHLLFNSLPYIVSSRKSETLISNLLKDDFSILFEGLHCCFHLNDERLKRRKKIVRMHNIEHNYYSNLAKVEKSFFRRKYFESEAKKLEQFESILKYADTIAAISPSDTNELNTRYKNAVNIMAFHPHDKIEIKEGRGDFALYHGSLAVGENNKAALYLVNEIFNDINIPFVIAGNGASEELKDAIRNKKNISLRENISTQEIYQLVQQAQLNILPTFQATGIKLKLLSALYTGKHCLVNSPMVKDTGLESLCPVADSSEEMKKEIFHLMKISFSEDEKLKREKILSEKFSNQANIRKLMELF